MQNIIADGLVFVAAGKYRVECVCEEHYTTLHYSTIQYDYRLFGHYRPCVVGVYCTCICTEYTKVSRMPSSYHHHLITTANTRTPMAVSIVQWLAFAQR